MGERGYRRDLDEELTSTLMRLNVPYVAQSTKYNCGPAALLMVLRYFGIDTDQEKLAAYLRPDKHNGTDERDLVYTVSLFGLEAHPRERTSVRRIVEELRRGRPVMVGYINKDGDVEEGHFAVVVGEERGVLILNDPWNGGPDVKFKKREFDRRWRSESGKYYRWMLAVDRPRIK